MSTPSEASRIFLIITMLATGIWSWFATDGNLVVWFSLTLLIATPILSIGWYLLSILAKNRHRLSSKLWRRRNAIGVVCAS